MIFSQNTKNIISNVNGQVINNLNEVKQFLDMDKDSKGLSYEGLRIDIIERDLKNNRKVYYVQNFPIKLISKRRQGWVENDLLNLINSLLKHFGIQGITNLKNFNKSILSKELLKEIKEHIPPIIISILPDETIELIDGNHRIALAEIFFELKDIRAFVSQ